MENNNIEKNFKNKLESYERFEGDRLEMWKNIEQELDEKKERKFIWFWLFPVLLGVLGMSWFVFGKTQSNENENISAVLNEKQKIFEESNGSAIDIEKPENKTFTKKQELTPNENQAIKTNTIRQQKNGNISHSKLKLFNTTSLSSDISSKREQDLINSTKLVQPKSEKDEPKILKKGLTVQYLSSLNFPLLDEVDDVPVIDTIMVAKVPEEDKNSPWSIRIGGGINSMTTGYNNNTTNGTIHVQTLTPLLGWNFLFELERTLSKDFYLTSGIHFNRNWLRFNYNSTINTPTILNDVILRYDVNLLSGDTTAIIGDTTLNEISTRDIQHHNQYDKLKIPILMGKRWNANRFSFGGAAGIGLDFWIKQSGRYLSEDEFGMFDSSSGETSLPKLSWSAELRGDFGFAINNKINLFAQPYLSVALKDWSIIGDGAIQKPLVYGTNFGLQIKF